MFARWSRKRLPSWRVEAPVITTFGSTTKLGYLCPGSAVCRLRPDRPPYGVNENIRCWAVFHRLSRLVGLRPRSASGDGNPADAAVGGQHQLEGRQGV